MDKKIVISGISMIILAIVLGAFGAHGLKEHVSAENIQSFEVGVRYQMYHGLAFLILGLYASKFQFSLKSIYLLLLFGTILFSVSIYFLAVQDVFNATLRFLGPITPLGGLLLILGWTIFIIKLIRSKD